MGSAVLVVEGVSVKGRGLVFPFIVTLSVVS